MRKDWLWSVMLLCLPLALLGWSRPVLQPGERQAVSGLKDGFARYVPKGTYLRGQKSGGEEDERPVHQVTLTQGVWMFETEVTQAQMKSLVGYNPSYFSSCGENCPVELVSWHEAAAFANALSQKQGVEVCFRCEGSGKDVTCEPKSHKGYVTCKGWRLPTEAEWEYAARAGTITPTYNGKTPYEVKGLNHAPNLDPIAWYGGNSGISGRKGIDCSGWSEKQYPSRTCGSNPVRRKQANAWGFHDMLGNVWEWCYDRKGAYSTRRQVDPAGPTNGSHRVIRGGSWFSGASEVRAASRNRRTPGHRGSVGFRLVKLAE